MCGQPARFKTLLPRAPYTGDYTARAHLIEYGFHLQNSEAYDSAQIDI
jgi:hypothetical protein